MAKIIADGDFLINSKNFTHPIYKSVAKLIKECEKFILQANLASILNKVLENHSLRLVTLAGKNIQFVNINTELIPSKPPTTKAPNKYYERCINEDGLIPTRNNNWHDFFNALSWISFPQIKKTISGLHQIELNRQTNNSANLISPERLNIRGAQRDFLTLFDEAGVIVAINQNEEISFEELVISHKWQEVFWQHRQQLINNVQFILIGHSIMEKARKPYAGITAKAFFVRVPNEIFSLGFSEIVNFCDENIAQILINGEGNLSPALLYPLPIFGYPEWFSGNNVAKFYQQTNIFRPS